MMLTKGGFTGTTNFSQSIVPWLGLGVHKILNESSPFKSQGKDGKRRIVGPLRHSKEPPLQLGPKQAVDWWGQAGIYGLPCPQASAPDALGERRLSR